MDPDRILRQRMGELRSDLRHLQVRIDAGTADKQTVTVEVRVMARRFCALIQMFQNETNPSAS